jgi:hypothetical protein
MLASVHQKRRSTAGEFTLPHATNNGLSIHYEVEGEDPPLILQHGSFGSLDD